MAIFPIRYNEKHGVPMLKNVLLILSLLLIVACTPKATVKIEEEPEKTVKSRAPVPDLPSAFAVREEVNVRRDASTASRIIASINDGDRVYILRNDMGWYQIQFGENQTGWVRSDLVGPRNLSRTVLAKAFVDSTLPGFNAQMFFDNEELYRTIYLVLPEGDYYSKATAAKRARRIAEVYQEEVYPGDLEVRVMQHDATDNLYLRLYLPAINIADVPLPVLPYGRLHSLEMPEKGHVKLWVLIPEGLPDDTLLDMARSISANYAYPFTRAEIYLIRDTEGGRDYLKNPGKPDVEETVLRLYYLEDKDGELYKFNVSGNVPPSY